MSNYNEKAIKELRYFSSLLVEADCEGKALNGSNLYSFRMCFTEEFFDVVQEAISAFEKQIPKPKHKYSGIRCVCGEVVARNQDYCEYCGQRLLPYEVDE